MSEEKRRIARRMREMSRGERGKRLALLDLSNDGLYDIYYLLRSDASSRGVARHLIEKHGVVGSENSGRQTVSKLKARIGPLLEDPMPLQRVRVPDFSEDGLPFPDRIQQLRDVERSYGALVKESLKSAAKRGTPLTPDMTKHVKALAELGKTLERLDQTYPRESAGHLPDDVFLAELDRRLQAMLEDHISPRTRCRRPPCDCSSCWKPTLKQQFATRALVNGRSLSRVIRPPRLEALCPGGISA